MQTLLLAIAVLIVTVFAVRGFLTASTPQLSLALRKIAGLLAFVGAIFFAVTGRALLAVPLGFLGLMLLARNTPFGQGGGGTDSRQPGSGQSSSVRTAFLEMVLDHQSGQMSGRVLAGALAGRTLASLAAEEMKLLWTECRAGDPQSRQLLEAYLDRMQPHWREDWRAAGDQRGSHAGNGGRASGRDGGEREDAFGRGGRARGRMSRDEALDVLGLKPGASEEEIKAAHRSLMKRFHPDQGGSTYLAAQINEAKDVLLGK